MPESVTAQAKPVSYNVYCEACDQIFTPAPKSALWWKAKKRDEKGFLDGYRCSAVECGCEKPRVRPDAPFRVFGYDGFCTDFDIPCDTFVQAVTVYRNHAHDMVFIEGVSDSVMNKLECM
jgi:hypothetical protein